MATAPAAAPIPIVIAHPFIFIKIPPFVNSLPGSKKFTQGKVSLFSQKNRIQNGRCYLREDVDGSAM
jgi:hypothetical protein